jgi:hypothetical protein
MEATTDIKQLIVQSDIKKIEVTTEIKNLTIESEAKNLTLQSDIKKTEVTTELTGNVFNITVIHYGYTHDQITAQSTWNIVHDLNRKPAVVVVDTAGNVVIGSIQYIDNWTITINFSAPFSGKAYLT